MTGAPLGEVQSLDTVLTENRKRSRRCSNTSVTSDLDSKEKVSDSTPMDAVVNEPARKRTRRCSNSSATSDLDSKEKVTDSIPMDAVVEEPAEDLKKGPLNIEDKNDTKENDVESKVVTDIKKETNGKITMGMDLNRYEKELKIKARCKSGRFWKSERDRFRSVIRSNKGLKSKQIKNYKNEREERKRIKAYEQSLKDAVKKEKEDLRLRK